MSKDQMTEIELRALQNATAEAAGIRPVGEVNAALAEILAEELRLNGESPEAIEPLIQAAKKQRTLDKHAAHAIQQNKNAKLQ